ncbi:MAG: hypothetical protein R3F19_17690 [Verrucomicrobiales bacterium]
MAQTSNSIPFSGLAAISTELCITSDLEIENLYVLRIRRENGAATNRTGDTAAVGGDVVHIFLGGAKVVGAQFGAVNVEVGRADMRHLNQNDARSEAGDDPLVEWRNSFGLNELALSSDVDGSGISLLLNVYSECILGVPMLHL